MIAYEPVMRPFACHALPALKAAEEQLDWATGRVDLIIGEYIRAAAPYRSSFDDVHRLVPHAVVHDLPGQDHLAHIQAPAVLAHLINNLGTVRIQHPSQRR